MFEMATVASSWTRHYMPILGPTNPPFSRWSWYPHPVGQSKLNNLFTYLSSRRVDSSKRLVNVHMMVAWGITACATHRFFGLMFQFMHDHDDLQWASHGPSMSFSQNTWQNMVRAGTGEYTCNKLAITYVFTQIISENTCHRHTINFHHGYRGIGPYFRQAEERGRYLPANHVI